MGSEYSTEKEKDGRWNCLLEVAMSALTEYEKMERLAKETTTRSDQRTNNTAIDNDHQQQQGFIPISSSTEMMSMLLNPKPFASNNLKLIIKKKKRNRMESQRPEDLPETLKQMIKDMGGSDAKVIIKKPLFKTDVSRVQNRLSIPVNQVKVEFLTSQEKNVLLNSSKGIEVMVIEPCFEKRKLVFVRWEMKTCSIYALRSGWYSVVKDNDLNLNNNIQVWSFRVDSKLCFALLRV